jgi:hypothetical protein
MPSSTKWGEAVVMNAPEELTHGDALLWLNDRLGRAVRVSVQLGKGAGLENSTPPVLMTQGELRHWREANPSGLAADEGDEEITGLYGIGDGAFLDATELTGASTVPHAELDILHFALDENVGLLVCVWPVGVSFGGGDA